MLRDNDFKMSYSTIEDDIQKDFYVKALSQASTYRRISGYFSSESLSYIAKGLFGLYKNKGKYQLIISNQISEEDFYMMKKGYINQAFISDYRNTLKRELSDFKDLSDEQKERFKNLSFLIEIGLVEVKIGFSKTGIFHAKEGIISDGSDSVYFSGSFNETGAAFRNNFESISVHKSWTDKESKESIRSKIKNFDKLWDDDVNSDMVTVKSINEVVKEELITFSDGHFINSSDDYSTDCIAFKYDGKLIMNNNYDQLPISDKYHYIRLIKSRYLVSPNEWIFKDNLDSKEVAYIMNSFIKYSKVENVNIHFDQTVYNFVKLNNDLPLDKLLEIGSLIKHMDDAVMKEYDKFKMVVSKGMVRKLREKQMWASFFMKSMQRAGNFSVPGSGKTSMVYGTYCYLREMNKVNRIVVIGTKSTFKSWKDEYKECFGNQSQLRYYDVQEDNNVISFNKDNYNLFLFNYESVVKNNVFINKILDNHTMLVFDEVHKIKNTDSEKAKLCIKISGKVKYCFALSGTPIPNSYLDIWNFMHILYDKDYSSVFGLEEDLLKNAKNETDSSAVINKKIYPFYWRTNKDDLDVPKANPDKLYDCKPNSDEDKISNYLVSRYRSNPMVLYTRLLQLSSNPTLLLDKISNQIDETDEDFKDIEDDDISEMFDTLGIDYIKNSTKYNKAIEVSDNLLKENKKIIIWCVFKDTMHKVWKDLSNKGYKVSQMSGDVDLNVREQTIDDFKNGKIDAIVANPQTMAESVSLHTVCHDALYLEYTFNLTHMLQSRDRIHRLGLEEDDYTNYYYFLTTSNNSKYIDKKIYDRLFEKEELMKKAIDGTELQIDLSVNKKEEILKIIEN